MTGVAAESGGYSQRRAAMGSTVVARRTGTYGSIRAAAIITIAATTVGTAVPTQRDRCLCLGGGDRQDAQRSFWCRRVRSTHMPVTMRSEKCKLGDRFGND